MTAIGTAGGPFLAPAPQRARGTRGCACHGRDRLLTGASVVTLVRTAAAVALALAGLVQHDPRLLLAALVTHWVGDVADGAVARWRDEETITGAVLDICADRLCVGLIYTGFVVQWPQFAPALGVYLFEFMLVDSVLSLAFLRWPVSSPNYFDRVDALVWRWNWWPPAKAANSAAVAVLVVAVGSPALALAVACLLLAVKVACLVRVSAALRARGEACAGHAEA